MLKSNSTASGACRRQRQEEALRRPVERKRLVIEIAQRIRRSLNLTENLTLGTDRQLGECETPSKSTEFHLRGNRSTVQ
jgi:hypothetical protein